jgi:hypothetical protein
MKKNKTLTVRYLANDRLKPRQKEINGKVIDTFPLYMQVIYNGENTVFKARLPGRDSLYTDRDLNLLDDKPINDQLSRLAKRVEGIVEDEIDKFDDAEYTVIGLGKRMSFYETTISDFLRSINLDQIIMSVTELEKNPSQFFSVIDLISDLILEFKKNVCGEWFFGEAKKLFEDYMYNVGAKDFESIFVMGLIEMLMIDHGLR